MFFIGLGVKLFQINNDNQRHSIFLTSRTLCEAEKLYYYQIGTFKNLFVCTKFRIYVFGFPINIYNIKHLIFYYHVNWEFPVSPGGLLSSKSSILKLLLSWKIKLPEYSLSTPCRSWWQIPPRSSYYNECWYL